MFSVSMSSEPAARRGAPAVCALILLAGAGGASAATGTGTGGWYATGTLGAVTQSDQRLAYSRPGITAVTSSTLPLDTGFAAGGAIGRYFGDAWRIEAEFMYQSVDHPTFTLAGGGPSGDGNYASTTVAVNLSRPALTTTSASASPLFTPPSSPNNEATRLLPCPSLPRASFCAPPCVPPP